jgi:hypothetical protein
MALAMVVIGSFVSLAAIGHALGLSALIGLLKLRGIVVTNAIVLHEIEANADVRTVLVQGGRTHAVVVQVGRVLGLRFHAKGRCLCLFVARAFPPSGVWGSDCQHRRAHGAWPERYFAPGVAPMKGSGPALPV